MNDQFRNSIARLAREDPETITRLRVGFEIMQEEIHKRWIDTERKNKNTCLILEHLYRDCEEYLNVLHRIQDKYLKEKYKTEQEEQSASNQEG